MKLVSNSNALIKVKAKKAVCWSINYAVTENGNGVDVLSANLL